MSFLHDWVLFPLILAVLSLGCGLLVERLAGTRLPGLLILPVGFAAIVVITGLATSIVATARLAIPAVVALAAVGLALGLPDRRRPDRWAVACVVLVFAVYAAPVVLSGQSTFAGYVKLDDTSTWLAMTDHVLQHGRDISNLEPSTYQRSLRSYIKNTGYPVGSVLPLGTGARLVKEDPIWTFQPYLAFQAVLLALSFLALVKGLVRAPWARAGVAFVAAQPALLYGYALWGSVKELVTVPLIALLTALVVAAARKETTARATLPLAVASAALLGALNVGGSVWLALALLPALVLARRVPFRAFLERVGVFAGFLVIMSVPTIATATSFFASAQHSLTTGSQQPYGNLIHSLSKVQIAGIWPIGDFRLRPSDLAPTYVLVAVTVAAAAAGLFLAARRRSGGLLIYVGVSLAGWVILAAFGTPWVDGKALATASPALLLAGMAGAAMVFEQGRRIEAILVAAAIAGGVGWSNYLQWHGVWLAPRDQLAELQHIGERYAGQGPALINEYQPYGGRHLLRRLDAESSGELRIHLLPLRDGSVVGKGSYADVDGFTLPAVIHFRTLVLPRSPIESRPPSAYSLASSGTFYDVWQRPDPYTPILEHDSLGRTRDVTGIPSCSSVLKLAKKAAAVEGRLRYVVQEPAISVDLARLPRPAGWLNLSNGIVPRAAGTMDVSIATGAGAYGVWLDGSFAGRMQIVVDGTPVGASRHRLEHPGQFVPFGTVRLDAGAHTVSLRYSGPDAHAGSAADLTLPLNRLVLARGTEDVAVQTIQPANARKLCGHRFDWIEAVA